ncbi:universal stress protein [Flaviaesturariibacter aridisoli]|uniref:Universal stress protein n=1 Tax=Flaviaesturariibacter aridisoli TaxID=2545761 RepID=A0A4V2WMX7_9BACT|nr:universal stress protein [Flaviaesturariibacter aridisoli]TCZ73342.1 universal stress protein [Flaviaesturariibacter aridisoli]
MEQILILLNANRPSASCIQFACTVAGMNHARLCGIFVETMPSEGYYSANDIFLAGAKPAQGSGVVTMDPEQAIRVFTDTCQREGVQSESVLIDAGPLPYAVRESYFADLLILSPDTGFTGDEEETPSSFTRDLLRTAACPVLLAPLQFDAFNETICCYDGSPSAVYALKTCSYLFPELAKERLTILEVTRATDAVYDEKHGRLLKWARCHYDEVLFQPLSGDTEEELFDYLFRKRGKLVVLGAYGRSLLSMLFQESTADRISRAIDLPLFITHL